MKSFEPEEIVQIVQDVCHGLLNLFQKNIIFTDLKPQNIGKIQGKWKIIDIDLNLSDPSCKGLIPFKQIKEITKPEILKLLEEQTENSFEIKIDIAKAAVWSLGLIIYELIYGREPVFDELFPPGYFIPEILKNLILNTLRINPTERISIEDIIKRLFKREIPLKKNIKNQQKMEMEKPINELEFSKAPSLSTSENEKKPISVQLLLSTNFKLFGMIP